MLQCRQEIFSQSQQTRYGDVGDVNLACHMIVNPLIRANTKDSGTVGLVDRVCGEILIGLFLRHTQWPPNDFALAGLRVNAASKPFLDI